MPWSQRLTRYVEDLDATKDRAAILQDELEARIGNQMNKTM
jgi:zinc transporter